MRYAVCEWQGRTRVGRIDQAAGEVVLLDVAEDVAASDGVTSLLMGARPSAQDSVPLTEVRLRAPIPRPRRNVFCVGKNYHAHAREFSRSGFDSSAAQGEIPKAPIVFSKVPESVVGTGDAVKIDAGVSSAIDYEAELGVVIGKAGRNIGREEAMGHVWGYTVINDVTARDLQSEHSQWLIGKSQDTFCPMGPWLVTADELDLSDTQVRGYVNDELRQDANTRDLIFDVPSIIAAISNGITLLPGDVIATGTPAGVGIGFDPPKYLVPGDVMRVEISGIGVLENPVEVF